MKTLQYLGKDRFEEIDYFYMNRVEERTKEKCVYHSHDFVEICYVASGSGCHLVNDKEYPVYKGDLFIINYDIYHTFIKHNPNDHLVTYNLVIQPGFIEKELLDLNDFSTMTLSYLFENIGDLQTNSLQWKADIRLTTQEQDDFDRLLGCMYNEYNLKQEGYANILKAHTIELVVKIMRCFSRKSSIDNSFHKKAQTIQNIIKYLCENYSQGFRLEELAVNSFFSKNYLCRIFKETTGMTISEYLQHLRIDNACKLISSTDRKVTDIAYDVGFSDYKSFNVVFKKLKGMSPGKYKKSQCD